MSVILVGVLCSRVTSQKNKLPPKKILVAIVVTVGIIMFRFFDPEADFSSKEGQKTEIFGLLLLLASLMSDGFLPDYQAEVKEKYKPGPTEMMLEVNKWSFIFCLVYAIVVNQFWYTLQYCWYYPLFTIHLVSMSVLTFVGQIFVYRMIKEFKQHIVPFVVTTRKIITVGFSLLYFHHKSSYQQVIGIVLVFIITSYEFLSEMLKDKRDDMLPVSRV
jgi:UDP-galactose transporter B1